MKDIIFNTKNWICALVLSFCWMLSMAQNPLASIEAESGTLTGGLTVANAVAGYSGTGYVTTLRNAADLIRINYTATTTGNYTLVIRYNSTFGPKDQDLLVNGTLFNTITFPQTTTYSDQTVLYIPLNTGANTISLRASWGYMDVDRFQIFAGTVTSPPASSNIADLIDPSASQKTKDVYDFLRSVYGKKIISGITSDVYDQMRTVTGRSALMRVYDMQNYSPMNPWGWANGGPAWGPLEDNSTQNAIDWYNSTNGKGIVSFQWHWFSPSGGTIRTSTFYSNTTNYRLNNNSVTTGTQDYNDIIRDIDAIAIQLKKLQTAGVPVLWRPLHEASGNNGNGWFWWGAGNGTYNQLTTNFKALWRLMYDRLTVHHGLHNLIWVYSYANNNGPRADWFNGLTGLGGNKKMVAMTENGILPDINQCFTQNAIWSYFMGWGGQNLVFNDNTNQQLTNIFNHPNVLTLENTTADCSGYLFGTAKLDNCGSCTGGNTGRIACTRDCNNVWGGKAVIDNCGSCTGGNTGRVACVRDCNGV
ncbi:MAG: hypothetical protein K2Q22_16335, partial [Cytophagales bacterium]|nr:hypothetical protein [Cytophagales bacterium]